MMEMIDIGIDSAVAFRMHGKITKDDMSFVLSEMSRSVEQHGEITIYEQIDSFDGVEIAAIAEEFKYLVDVGFSNIAKIAILADKNWIERIVSIENQIFRNIDMKCFPLDNQDKAIAFLKAV